MPIPQNPLSPDDQAQTPPFTPNSTVVILNKPAHGGNVGAVARAMSNMGFSLLRLVSPRQFPHPEAYRFAANSGDILDNAVVFSNLSDAVADLNFLVATTNRHRGQRQIVLTPQQLGKRLPTLLSQRKTRVGLLFGTERTGLETVDVERADIICNIPTAGQNGSLNLAQAVLIITYEIMSGLEQGQAFDFDPQRQGERAEAADLDRLFHHMKHVLTKIQFLKPGQDQHMMGSLKAIVHRAALDKRETAILRGILNEIIAAPVRLGFQWPPPRDVTQ